MIKRKNSMGPFHRKKVGRKEAVSKTKELVHSCGSKHFWLVTIPLGLGPFVMDELRKRNCRLLNNSLEAEEISFTIAPQSHRELLSIRTATSLFRCIHLPIDRPRGITSYEYRDQLKLLFEDLFSLTPVKLFHALRLEGAGNDSPTFRRLGEFFSQMTGIDYSPDKTEADLVIRIRPSPHGRGWEILVRATPRPLSTRSWRVVNFRGAVSAPIAAAMLEVAQPKQNETVLNIPCGSGTILAELCEKKTFQQAIGVDLSDEALRAAVANLQRWRSAKNLKLAKGDLSALPIPDSCASVILSDPPWGEGLGSREQARRMYPMMLKEMHRVLTERGRLVILSQDERALHEIASSLFERERSVRVYQGGFRPQIILYRKRASSQVQTAA
jgi:tRNA (guanine6-N2)-methyltransferase